MRLFSAVQISHHRRSAPVEPSATSNVRKTTAVTQTETLDEQPGRPRRSLAEDDDEIPPGKNNRAGGLPLPQRSTYNSPPASPVMKPQLNLTMIKSDYGQTGGPTTNRSPGRNLDPSPRRSNRRPGQPKPSRIEVTPRDVDLYQKETDRSNASRRRQQDARSPVNTNNNADTTRAPHSGLSKKLSAQDLDELLPNVSNDLFTQNSRPG